MNTKLITVLAAGMCGAAFGQAEKTPAQPATATPPAEHSPLAGPKVPDRTGKPTLVERSADGKVVRLDEWPALAAARKLKLDDKTRAAISKLEVEQTTAMDKFLGGNLLAVAAVANSFQSGNMKEGLAGIRKLRDEHPILNQRELLGQKISGLLDKEQATELRLMTEEYWNALIQEETETAKAKGEKASMGKVASGEALRLLGQDIKASYERVIGQRVKDFDALIKTLGLSAEQESRVRKITDEAFAKSKGNYDKVNKSDVFWKIWRELDAHQRDVLVEQIKKQQGEK
jgi:hypothetical protein